MREAKTVSSRSTMAVLALALVACQKQAADSPCPPSASQSSSGGSVATSAGNGSIAGAAPALGGSEAVGGTGAGASAGAGGAPVTSVPDSTACAALSLQECQQHAGCQELSGRRVSVEPPCLESETALACGTSQGCVVAPVRATDNQGTDWIFPTSCVPAGFSDVTATGTRFDDCTPQAMGGAGGRMGGGNSFPGGSASTGGTAGTDTAGGAAP